jgi:hypothetical protein
MKKIQNITVWCLLLSVLTVAWTSVACAGNPHKRDGWILGVAYGMGLGEVTFSNELVGETRDGAIPQIRFGHMLGENFSATVEYDGWVYELGRIPDKFRVSLQQVMAGLTWYPGSADKASGGMYLRACAGLGWAGLAAIELDEDLLQTHGARIDESGLGLAFAFGYEMRIVEDLAAGLSVGYNYLDIGGDIYDEAYFVPLTFSLNWYWD